MNKAVIMAGGEGVRLRPLTYAVPKPLLPLGTMTVIEYIIRGLAEQGIAEIFILVHYQAEKFEACLEYQKKYGIKIKLVKEEKKLGTIGGLSIIAEELAEPFLLVNADIINRIDIKAMDESHAQEKSFFTMGVKDYSQQVPYGVVELGKSGEFASVREKPVNNYLISAGINLLSPYIFKYLRGEPIDLPDVIRLLLQEGKKVSTHRIRGFWFDIGRAEDYENAIELLEQIENGK